MIHCFSHHLPLLLLASVTWLTSCISHMFLRANHQISKVNKICLQFITITDHLFSFKSPNLVYILFSIAIRKNKRCCTCQIVFVCSFAFAANCLISAIGYKFIFMKKSTKLCVIFEQLLSSASGYHIDSH